jgi:hypothetical protein
MSAAVVAPGLAPGDRAVVAIQLGREPEDVSGVAVRCPFGRPAVIETRPLLRGAPNPTLLYLTCPYLVNVVSRVEAAGGVRALKAAFASDEHVRRALLEVTRAYQKRRALLAEARVSGDESAPGDRETPSRAVPRDLRASGIGGPSDPSRASCLHAYAAALLAVRSGWLPPVAGVEVVWERLGLPATAMWCDDDRCREHTRQSERAEVT